jgi:hypothetical protein
LGLELHPSPHLRGTVPLLITFDSCCDPLVVARWELCQCQRWVVVAEIGRQHNIDCYTCRGENHGHLIQVIPLSSLTTVLCGVYCTGNSKMELWLLTAAISEEGYISASRGLHIWRMQDLIVSLSHLSSLRLHQRSYDLPNTW